MCGKVGWLSSHRLERIREEIGVKRSGWKAVDGWLVGVAACILYGLTAAPGIAALFDDSLEFQLISPTFAIAHPTGYPLYTLLGGLWSRVIFPFGNWAWRMNLFSALAGGAGRDCDCLRRVCLRGPDRPETVDCL